MLAIARGAERLIGQQQETGCRVRLGHVPLERLCAPGSQRLGPPHHHQPEGGLHGHGERSVDHGVDVDFAPVEDVAVEHRQGRLHRHGPGRRPQGVVEELGVTPVQQGDRRQLTPLGAPQEGDVIHGARG